MSFENILPFIIVSGSFIIALIISIPLWKSCKWPWKEESEDDVKKWVQEERRKYKYEKAVEAYEAIKKAGCEDVLKALDGYNSDEAIDTLCAIGNYIGALGISTEDASNALKDLAASLEDYVETPKQKEPQVIFEPKAMIIEPQDQNPIMIVDNIISVKQDGKEVNPFDDWYDNFMKEIKNE